ncbi:MAG: MG284/MPN403 family protein [Metamycoplasmataceae bacterium]|uniref:MG284/MPN403 family protein n=1 Tax=Mycoplasmopsis lipophila TaxID=2117 RepID=UPI0038736B75
MQKDLINFYYKDLISIKEKEEAVKTICKMEKINAEANRRIKLLLKTDEKNLDYKTLLLSNKNNHFKKVLDSLDPLSYLIILNTYIKQHNDKDWMDEYFSRSTYYKRRKIALEEFLYLYFC